MFRQACRQTKQMLVLGLLSLLISIPGGQVFAKGGGHGGDDRGGRSGGGRFDESGDDRGRGRGSDDGISRSRDDGGSRGRGGSHHLRGSSSGHRHGIGTVVRELPRGHRQVVVDKRTFFFHEGRFFNRHHDGFIVVRAPLGAVITALPLGFVAFAAGGIDYYLADDTYYRRVPNGYAVVEAPLPAVSGTGIVQAELLNVRTGPATSYDVIRVVHYGDYLAVIGSVPGWLNVELPDGTLGWVMGRFVQLQPDQPEG